MTSDALIPIDFDFDVECHGETHTIEVRDGMPRARDHDEENERALEALGGDVNNCVFWCDTVRFTPRQLHRSVDWELELGEQRAARVLPNVQDGRPRRVPTEPAGFFTTKRQMAGLFGESLIDVPAIPRTFWRLGYLACESERDGDPEATIKKWAACTLAEGMGLLGVRFEVDEVPGIRAEAAGYRTVTLARDWLRTVVPLGLEIIDGNLTLGARFMDDEIILIQYRSDERAHEVRMPMHELLPNIRIPREARA